MILLLFLNHENQQLLLDFAVSMSLFEIRNRFCKLTFFKAVSYCVSFVNILIFFSLPTFASTNLLLGENHRKLSGLFFEALCRIWCCPTLVDDLKCDTLDLFYRGSKTSQILSTSCKLQEKCVVLSYFFFFLVHSRCNALFCQFNVCK